jgi:hypothetical protein
MHQIFTRYNCSPFHLEDTKKKKERGTAKATMRTERPTTGGARGAAAQSQRPRICASGETVAGGGTSAGARGCRSIAVCLAVVHRCPPTVRSFAPEGTRPLSLLPRGHRGLLLLFFCLCLEIAILDTWFILSRMGQGQRAWGSLPVESNTKRKRSLYT